MRIRISRSRICGRRMSPMLTRGSSFRFEFLQSCFRDGMIERCYSETFYEPSHAHT